MSSNSLSTTNTKNGTFNNLYLINDDGEVENVKDLFSQTNTNFTGNIGINLTSIDTNDSALFVKGARIANPSTTGIRFGTSNGLFTGNIGDSYGIEICSKGNSGSAIDFTYPSSYYAGRILFDNLNSLLHFTLGQNLQQVS